MGCFVRGGKNGMGCFVQGDKNCMGCFVRGGKLMRDVLSGVAKNGMGCFVPGCFVLHSFDHIIFTVFEYESTERPLSAWLSKLSKLLIVVCTIGDSYR